MIWIRSPWWDGVWLLSGIPIGIVATAMVFAGVPYFWMLAFVVIVFQTAHTLSPIALAWSHPGFRRLMLHHRLKFIGAPLGIIAAFAATAYVGSWYWPPPSFDPIQLKLHSSSFWEPMMLLGMVYSYWNIYHFGKQNFGVMSIYRLKAGVFEPSNRRRDLIFCCTMCWSAMAIGTIHVAANYLRSPILTYHHVLWAYVGLGILGVGLMLWYERGHFTLPRLALILSNAVGCGTVMIWPLGGIGIISMNHWLTAIGLAGHTARRPVLMPVMLCAAGAALFCALFPQFLQLMDDPRRTVPFAATAVAFRFALGIVHFLYDRWVWKLSDSQVRATIGRDLLAQREFPITTQFARQEL